VPSDSATPLRITVVAMAGERGACDQNAQRKSSEEGLEAASPVWSCWRPRAADSAARRRLLTGAQQLHMAGDLAVSGREWLELAEDEREFYRTAAEGLILDWDLVTRAHSPRLRGASAETSRPPICTRPEDCVSRPAMIRSKGTKAGIVQDSLAERVLGGVAPHLMVTDPPRRVSFFTLSKRKGLPRLSKREDNKSNLF
jgi:hypothetical protein